MKDNTYPKGYTCKNIFLDGKTQPSKTQVTKAWADLINTIEKNKKNSSILCLQPQKDNV